MFSLPQCRDGMCKVVPIHCAARVVFSPREQVHDFSNNASNLIMAVIHLLSICSALSVPDFVGFAEELAREALEIFDCCESTDPRQWIHIKFQSTGSA